MMRGRWIVMGVCLAGGCVPNYSPAEAPGTRPMTARVVVGLEPLQEPLRVEAYAVGKLEAHPGFGGKLDGYGVYANARISPEDADLLRDAARRFWQDGQIVAQQEFLPVFGCRYYHAALVGPGLACADVLLDRTGQTMLIVTRDARMKELSRKQIDSSSLQQNLVQICDRGLEPTTQPVETQAVEQ